MYCKWVFWEDGRLIIVEMEKEKIKIVLSIKTEVNRIISGEMKETATAHVFEYYNEAHSLDYFIRVVDPRTLNQSEVAFQDSGCAITDTALNQILRVHKGRISHSDIFDGKNRTSGNIWAC